MQLQGSRASHLALLSGSETWMGRASMSSVRPNTGSPLPMVATMPVCAYGYS